MDDDLRTAIVEFLDNELGVISADFELIAEELEIYLNKRGFYFYDERYAEPERL